MDALDFLHNSIFEREKREISNSYAKLDDTQKGYVTIGDLISSLKNTHGVDTSSNKEVKQILQDLINKQYEKLLSSGGPQSQVPPLEQFQENLNSIRIEFSDFYALMQPQNENEGNIVQRAFTGKLAVPNWGEFIQECVEIFDQVRDNSSGKNADYIPQLAEADSSLYGFSICTVDGQKFSYGDYDHDFTIQSCSKVFTYCIACEDIGVEALHNHVGFEPSGVSFNAFTLDDRNKPHNPMINAGAITVCSLILPNQGLSKRFKYISDKFSDFAGATKMGFDNATYLSEKDTADRNFALAYYMKENNVFLPHTRLEDTLDLYFQACSITVTCEKVANMAATMANGGKSPLTDKKVVSEETVKCALQLMTSCGMYDYSGEWGCAVGVPAKSGVAGAVFLVIPSVMGICVFSPRLDKRGNSVRGVEFCTRASKKFGWSIFDRLVRDEEENDNDDDDGEDVDVDDMQTNSISQSGVMPPPPPPPPQKLSLDQSSLLSTNNNDISTLSIIPSSTHNHNNKVTSEQSILTKRKRETERPDPGYVSYSNGSSKDVNQGKRMRIQENFIN